MNQLGILAILHARPGKEADVERIPEVCDTLLVQAETGTTAWYSFRIGPAIFGSSTPLRTRKGELDMWRVKWQKRCLRAPRNSLRTLHKSRQWK